MDYTNEKNYIKNIGKEGEEHARNKPFSDRNCGVLLAAISAVISLLPKRSLRILDMGCGTGWTSIFFSKMGHSVLGIDISKDMIKNAEINKKKEKLSNLDFKVENAEEMNFNSEFDCVIFIDSLHHCDNTERVIKNAYNALKKGGICIISEPGLNHSKAPYSINAVKKYGVLEKDMPPKLTRKIGKRVGFIKIKVYPREDSLNQILYSKEREFSNLSLLKRFFKNIKIKIIPVFLLLTLYKRYSGVVVMEKN